ncbi:TPA: 30S ribosomal protein S13 [bacterium]|nr:MAG: 30S ribosomal protein S13 [Candidatus Hydrogenedentes bacterium CG1_02_42_14]PIU47998.1 MAG: 30S ribosomal protein S13 [Candidatus Hydrogenedentes bacterium CG07_land_8_20_14_0_80_42_17]HBW46650.1 30S ribosomal protein S13 [bacterium]
MARIAGVDLPREKRLQFALPYIYGIGRTKSKEICDIAKVDGMKKVKDLTDADVAELRKAIERLNLRIEGDLRAEIMRNVKRLIDVGTYRGQRHKKSLPVRGQRTHTNARTRKGPRKAINVKRG